VNTLDIDLCPLDVIDILFCVGGLKINSYEIANMEEFQIQATNHESQNYYRLLCMILTLYFWFDSDEKVDLDNSGWKQLLLLELTFWNFNKEGIIKTQILK
jgi:hypothetical protein